ncbi:MAG: beta-ketoacyl-[acyl-carrier-protein] synthase family protein [Spirochaetes bacterium]|nr:beta-ketoacyl-[acyl-carrier-protein] synthase family protein [Spirochaetota bacterium]
MNRRVVITGTGIISSIGLNTKDFWNKCLSGKSNIHEIPEHWNKYANFNTKIWSPLPEIDFNSHNINRIELKKSDKTSLLALSTVQEALKSSNFEIKQENEKNNTYKVKGIDSARAGVYIGTGIGGVSTLGECFANQMLFKNHEELDRIIKTAEKENYDQGFVKTLIDLKGKMIFPLRFNPFAVSMIMANSPAANIAIKYNINGVNNTFCAACASGTVAIGNAFNSIKNNLHDIAITGGVEYFYDEYGALFYSFDVLKTLAQNIFDKEKANRPFDRDRSGFLYSEGGCGIIIMEDMEHALKRNAPIIAEVIGYAETCDGYNIMVLDGQNDNIPRMIYTALKNSGIEADKIDYINTHGTGTLVNDQIESRVIENIFGKRPLINSTKSILGHTLGASGAIETVVTALSIKNKTTHISKNLDNPIRDLNFVLKSGNFEIKYALTQSFGFGGHNACLVLKEYN